MRLVIGREGGEGCGVIEEEFWTGLWMAKRFAARSKLEGDADGRKRATTVADIIEKHMDEQDGQAFLADEKKYNFINKFGPKKLPDQVVARSSLKHLYTW